MTTSNKENVTEYQVKNAELKLLGTKFCFACQRAKPADTGRYLVRGTNKTWKCADCASKMSKTGFSKRSLG